MKFQIKEEKIEEEDVIEFWLESINSDSIYLKARKGDGRAWYLLKIEEDGISLCQDIDEDIGISKGYMGSLLLKKKGGL
jgi:hypothetical protein